MDKAALLQGDPAILWPVIALAGWTLGVLLLVAISRISAALSGRVPPVEYAFGESIRVPPHISLFNRNYMNLLELPVLFYVACLMAYVTGLATAAMVTLAWAYVGLRMAHTLVHVTYNRVTHRLIVFAASNFALLFLWALVVKGLWAGV